MMATTHALAGALLGAVALLVAPEQASVAVAAGMAGGFFPDVDLYAGHRKTLHFPVYYSVGAVGAVALAALAPGPWTVGLAAFVAAAALHSAMDVLGGGLELRPWRGTSDRAVYDHYRGRWLRPRRLVRYDGAPEDLALAGLLAAPGFLLYDPGLQPVVAAVVAVSAAYALLRKRMVAAAEWLVDRVPADLLAYVPDRFVGDLA